MTHEIHRSADPDTAVLRAHGQHVVVHALHGRELPDGFLRIRHCYLGNDIAVFKIDNILPIGAPVPPSVAFPEWLDDGRASVRYDYNVMHADTDSMFFSPNHRGYYHYDPGLSSITRPATVNAGS